VKSYVSIFDREIDSSLRDNLLLILDNFVNHAVQLDDFDTGWKQFMRKYLTSIQHIVGQQAIVVQSSKSDAASVPTSFIEELEGLRAKVEELDEEVCRFI
jgi:diaphanous 1